MTHAKRHLIGALLTALAIAALAAPGAGAAELTAFNTTTGQHESGTFSGDQTTTHLITAGEGVGSVTCAKAHFAGSSTTGTEPTPIVTPTYSDCHSVVLGTTYKLHITMNGCKYQFHITGGSADKWTGTWDIVGCNAGQKIDFKLTKSGSEETKCTTKYGEQTGLNNVTFENATTKSPTHLIMKFQTSNITSETEGGLLGCGIANGVHEKVGTYTGSTTIKALNTAGTPIDLTVM